MTTEPVNHPDHPVPPTPEQDKWLRDAVVRSSKLVARGHQVAPDRTAVPPSTPGEQPPATVGTPWAWGTPGGDCSRSLAWCQERCLPDGPQPFPLYTNPAPPATPAGEVVVTKNMAGQIIAVTRQDEEGRILSVIAESAAPPATDREAVEVLAELVAAHRSSEHETTARTHGSSHEAALARIDAKNVLHAAWTRARQWAEKRAATPGQSSEVATPSADARRRPAAPPASLEPVAEVTAHGDTFRLNRRLPIGTPLYTSPPAREGDESLRAELENLANTKRFDRAMFRDDTEWADWAQSRARHVLAKVKGVEGFGLTNDATAAVAAYTAEQMRSYALLAVAQEREMCAKVAEAMQPPSGRAWSPEQLACWEALGACAEAIRKEPKE